MLLYAFWNERAHARARRIQNDGYENILVNHTHTHSQFWTNALFEV